MRKRTFVTSVSVLIVLIFAMVGKVSSQQNEVKFTEFTTPTPVPISPTVTPTPAKQEVAGELEEIGDKVAYKNATLMKVNGTSVYITDATHIVDPDNQELTQENLQKGVAVIVDGVPAGGGIEAERIIVVMVGNTTSTPSPTP